MDKIKSFIKETGIYIAIIIAVILVKTYVVAPIRVNGTSMVPTLHHKDIMILDKASYRFSNIKRFDIVVIEYEDEYLIKRVIGLPGERIGYLGNQLYINGKKVAENFEHAETRNFSLADTGVSKIPEDCYFVVGDNRINSKDSRMIGVIEREKIVGKSTLTVFPLTRIGFKK